jgi:hypothetical protein
MQARAAETRVAESADSAAANGASSDVFITLPMRGASFAADIVVKKYRASARSLFACLSVINQRRDIFDPTSEDIKAARSAYAEELRYVAHVKSQRVIDAFANVPREAFLGPQPWRVFHFVDGYWDTPGEDPRSAYHNVLFAIDEARRLNNGQPEFWARLLDKLDIPGG